MHLARPRPLRAGAWRFALGLNLAKREAQPLSEHRYQPLPGLVFSGSTIKIPSSESTWRSRLAFGRRRRQMTHMRTGPCSFLSIVSVAGGLGQVFHHGREKIDGRTQIGNARLADGQALPQLLVARLAQGVK